MQDLALAERPYHLSRRNRQVTKARDLHMYKVYRVNMGLVCLCSSYFVTGDTEGHIKFYDEEFKLLIRYTELSLDTIVFISFSKECTERPLDSCGLRAEPRIVR